jgi:tRNA-specific 2-thiouridylase
VAKILVAMSGGVDSSVSAYLLKSAGHEIEGVYLRLHEDDDKHRQNIEMVERAAGYLGIKYRVLDLREKFRRIVYEPFAMAYLAARTPNPCVTCNRNIKFGALLEYALDEGFERLATGHYVRVRDNLICEAADKSKDQSYFLAQIRPEILGRLVFPLGDRLKRDIKEFALTIPELAAISEQKESSEICFVQDSYTDILRRFARVDQLGEVLDSAGRVIGEHQGFAHYTIGKRRGFEVHGAHEPHYVTRILPETNQIVVGPKDELLSREFTVSELNMFVDETEFECGVKVRYRSPKTPAQVTLNADKTSAKVEMKESVSALARGQLAVFYRNESVIGSGIID